MDRFDIRKATVDDVAIMQVLEDDAGRRYADYEPTRFCTDLGHRDVEEHQRVLERGLALIAQMGGTAAGFILLLPMDGRVHILELAVALDRQGRGIGRALLAAADAWAAEQGYYEITLTTFRDVPWNAPFYASLGFDLFEVGSDRPELTEVIAHEVAVGVHAAPRVAMRKILPGGLQGVRGCIDLPT